GGAGVRGPGRHRGRARRRRLVPPPGPPDHHAIGAQMTDQFPVEWLDPSAAEVTWEWDDMHMPGALSALAGDYTRVIGAGMAYGHQRMGPPVEMRVRVWNGYASFGLATDVPEAEQEAMWERRTVAARAAIQDADAYWHGRGGPGVAGPLRWCGA